MTKIYDGISHLLRWIYRAQLGMKYRGVAAARERCSGMSPVSPSPRGRG
jgi:hypothetical protein